MRSELVAEGGHDLRVKLKRFIDNLDLQIADLMLEEEGREVWTYFDTVDVRQAVIGLYAFLDPVTRVVDERAFREPRALVRSLAASGWLGTVRMLPPHQSEFLNLLNMRFGLRIQSDFRNDAARFLGAIGVTERLRQELLSLKDSPPHDVQELVRTHAGSAPMLYKAIQCVRGTWDARLERMCKQEHLRIERTTYPYDAAFATDLFAKLKREFDGARPDRSLNNVADAVAAVMLGERVASEAPGSDVPRVLVPSALFRQVISRVAPPVLGCLRDNDYFIFKATFRPPRELIDAAEGAVDLYGSAELRDLRAKSAAVLEAQEPLTEALLSDIQVSGRSLGQIIDAVTEVSFLENVWLPFLAARYVNEARSAIEQASLELMTSAPFKQGMRDAIRDAIATLSADADEYRRLSSLFVDLEEGARQLRLRVRPIPAPDDILRVFGLVRFGFPPSARVEIVKAFEHMLSTDEEVDRSARNAVVAAVSSSAISAAARGDQDAVDALCLALAVAWVLRLDRHFMSLFKDMPALPDASLSIVQAAMIFRGHGDLRQGVARITSLRAIESARPDGIERATARIGLGYLLFHFLVARGFSPAWRDPNAPLLPPESEISQHGHEAIAAARQAYAWFRSNRSAETQELEVWSLNQYLFYLVEVGRDEQFWEAKQLAQALAAYKPARALWVYRYDDTLARYFHRLSVLEQGDKRAARWRDEAMRAIDEACDHSYGDEESRSYRTILAAALV